LFGGGCLFDVDDSIKNIDPLNTISLQSVDLLLARLIKGTVYSKFVICAGKKIARKIRIGLEIVDCKKKEFGLCLQLYKGVSYSKMGTIYLFALSRLQSAGFYLTTRKGVQTSKIVFATLPTKHFREMLTE
jgi:hypothetical protein